MLRLIATLALTLIGWQAQAGLMIEPYVGYERSAAKADFKIANIAALTDASGTMTGTSYGLRLGYKLLLGWVALDYSAGSGKMDIYNEYFAE